jgi:hypothetical protein
MKNQVLCQRCQSQICCPRVPEVRPNSCDDNFSEFTPEERLQRIALLLLKAIRRAMAKAGDKGAPESAPRSLGADSSTRDATPA